MSRASFNIEQVLLVLPKQLSGSGQSVWYQGDSNRAVGTLDLWVVVSVEIVEIVYHRYHEVAFIHFLVVSF